MLPENRLSESHHIVLARRMATWITLIYSFLFVGIFIGYGCAWLNSHKSFLPQDMPLTLLELCFVIGITGVLAPTVFSLIFHPQVMDWQLNLYNTARTPFLDERLNLLQRFANIQHDLGNLRRRPKLFLSDEIQMNALTYGGFLKEPRVVFASDLFEKFSDLELQGVLCHELGHVNHGDYFMTVAFHYILRVLDILFWPFRFVNNLLDGLVLLTYGIPFVGVLVRLILYILKLLVALFLLPIWLVRALHSWEGQLREYIADDYAVRLMDSADGILSSLMKLEDAQIELFEPEKQEESVTSSNIQEQGAQPEKKGDTTQKSGAKKRPVIAGKYRRYATVIYEAEQSEPETTFQMIYALLERLNDTHPPGEQRWKRIARVGFQIESIHEERELVHGKTA